MATKLIVGTNDLVTLNPSLAAEWDYKKNTGFRPEMFTAGSSKKVWWVGKCGHNWPATIASRNSGVGCPICAKDGISARVREAAARKNGSLKEKCPLLLADWDYDQNVDFGPNEVAIQSHKAVWWKCHLCDHEWSAIIRDRVNGSACPQCGYRSGPVIQRKAKKLNQETIIQHKPRPIRTTLSAGNPRVAAEWHPTKNGSLTPDDIAFGSHTKVWWQCNQGHEWMASPNHRTSKTRNCPYCCANPSVLPGVNDLATTNPKLANEWNDERNGLLTPDRVTAHSNRVVWWKCSLGHEWKTAINHRSNGSGCPRCEKGKQTSFPEQAVFYYVSQNYPDAVNGYTDLFKNHGMELDIYIPSIKIGIEYDGLSFHKSKIQKEREVKKYQRCREEGITLIRIREDIHATDDISSDHLILLTDGLEKGILELSSYVISICDVNLERDRNQIDACYKNNLEKNSLQTNYPGIAAEWNYSKNHPLTPAMFYAKSNRTVWWICSKGHEWKATIDSRVRGTGCPYCSNNKILKGYNDLATKRPDLMQEWDFDKNDGLNPTALAPGSGKKAWWKCASGHSWRAEISSRNKGHGCPYCSGNRIKCWSLSWVETERI